MRFSFDPHERLKRHLLSRVIEDEGELSPGGLTVGLDPALGALLADVCGDTSEGTGRLAHRFPILGFEPPAGFVERCYLHFLDRLELKTLESDLDADIAQADQDLTTEGEARILAISRELARRRQAFLDEDRDLADLAKEIRGAHAAADADRGPVMPAAGF